MFEWEKEIPYQSCIKFEGGLQRSLLTAFLGIYRQMKSGDWCVDERMNCSELDWSVKHIIIKEHLQWLLNKFKAAGLKVGGSDYVCITADMLTELMKEEADSLLDRATSDIEVAQRKIEAAKREGRNISMWGLDSEILQSHYIIELASSAVERFKTAISISKEGEWITAIPRSIKV